MGTENRRQTLKTLKSFILDSSWNRHNIYLPLTLSHCLLWAAEVPISAVWCADHVNVPGYLCNVQSRGQRGQCEPGGAVLVQPQGSQSEVRIPSALANERPAWVRRPGPIRAPACDPLTNERQRGDCVVCRLWEGGGGAGLGTAKCSRPRLLGCVLCCVLCTVHTITHRIWL